MSVQREKTEKHLQKKNKGILARQPLDWIIIVQDESIFTYDVKIRKVWAIKGSRPIILTTGSKRKTVLFGALGEDEKQLFRQYKTADSDAFLDYLKQLRRKWPKMLLFIDKAPWHKEKRVKSFLRKHKDSIRVFWFPTANPEANPVEECWNQGKDKILGSTFYHSFEEFQNAIVKYYRTRRMRNRFN